MSTSLPRATLTSSAPSGSSASSAAPIRPSVCGVCGAMRNATSASRQQPVQVLDRVHLAAARSWPRRATRVTEATSKPSSRRSIACPMCPYPTIRTRWSASARPNSNRHVPAGLIAGELVQVPPAGQGEGDGQFGRAGVVQAGRVAQRHPRRHQRQELLVAGREGLHHLELGHLRGPVQDGRPLHVGQDVEGDLVDGAGQLVSRPPGRSRAPARRGCRSGGVRPRHGRRRAPRRVA